MEADNFLYPEHGVSDSGVLKYSLSPSYWSLLSQDVMKSFLAEVKTKGWQKAISTSSNPKIKALYLFTDSPSRADGTFYLSLNDQSRVLDLGSGWGSYTFALSPRVKEVVAADANLESLEFIALRARQDNCCNISAVQIEPLDFAKLPFVDGIFDAVIMNGVLEWVGSHLKKGDPLKIQQNCLKEVSRVLKPGGKIWLGTENRFGLRYFLGAPDDHLKYYSEQGIAYTTLVPRFIASLITKKKLGQPYRTYTHSLAGLKRLLGKAGFSNLEFYYPDPDYRSVSPKIFPIISSEVSANITKRQPVWFKVITFPIKRFVFCDSFFVAARREK
ncbi:hypothetical protein COT42_03075 [Candidatus Saganbacteria bacterium CG08_land_8_20_14_0_20_45_16]|uniref:Methyltransferase type 11 domain-containing protein n=1 Tax=Candidatus Saganbacteria bacterium CG08_land_8_20_14_0_20_45_16 TaxID=2014293 RepID=A0A2H0Y1I2_UNCSA|nr:MAG: hypothetical protein COT42_03075 [Candidatus Saganbacteria bacterium CG08_land_8_20_14_0_20_45_16]